MPRKTVVKCQKSLERTEEKNTFEEIREKKRRDSSEEKGAEHHSGTHSPSNPDIVFMSRLLNDREVFLTHVLRNTSRSFKTET